MIANTQSLCLLLCSYSCVGLSGFLSPCLVKFSWQVHFPRIYSTPIIIINLKKNMGEFARFPDMLKVHEFWIHLFCFVIFARIQALSESKPYQNSLASDGLKRGRSNLMVRSNIYSYSNLTNEEVAFDHIEVDRLIRLWFGDVLNWIMESNMGNLSLSLFIFIWY